ncbi:isochorismatase family protein [Mesorhizobium sp. YC-39]|uniref:isochorismatase family protein n=1 Tax=unclassified Mesorhizobium TaxID=325217 RepID=UPI0021E8580E|nr:MULTISPECIES: isochorismatase family protein [unclassified Mesorhizobium]MCV3209337.1 isochorismatase family protein [Mesorhizobium sp. YC-2]MCV3231313.1 isochorismatase family protein [Mesorhizobium sp. YC-39]
MLETSPSATAPLIVIDLQTGMFDGVAEPPIHDASGIAARAGALIEWARRGGRKIAFVRHDGPEGDPLAPGEPGWPVWPALGQAGDEPTFAKSVGDAFSNAALGEWVAGQGVGEVVLIGAQTDHCVAATVMGAMAAGLGVTVVSDAHSTMDSASETAGEIIARHNAEFAKAGVNVVTTNALTGG